MNGVWHEGIRGEAEEHARYEQAPSIYSKDRAVGA